MAEDQGRQRGEDDRTELATARVLTLGDPQVSPVNSPIVASTSARTRSASASDGKKPGYYSGRGYLKELPRPERRRIEREIRKRRKPGEETKSV